MLHSLGVECLHDQLECLRTGFSYFNLYRLIDVYFKIWVIIKCQFFFVVVVVAQIVSALTFENSSSCATLRYLRQKKQNFF